MNIPSKLTRLSVLIGAIYSIGAVADIEEVIVTAQKRAESAQDVPISISAFTGDMLQDAGITNSEDLGLVTPGLNITQSGAGSVVFMRGIGNPDASGAQEQAVGTYVDGVWFGSVTGSWLELNSVERVEVLKGPQGTLFGRNTTGGVINIFTKDPSQEAGADISLTAGNYDYTGLDFYGTTGITDKLAADLTVTYSNQGEGYGDNLVRNEEIEGKEDAIFARTKWKYSGDSFDVTASFFVEQYDDPRAHNRRMPEGSISINGETAPSDFWDISQDYPVFGEFDNEGASLRIDKSFSNFDFVSITGYLSNDAEQVADNDSSGAWEMNADLRFYSEQISQEFQILSNDPDSRLSWIGGLYFLDMSAKGFYRLDGASMQRTPFFGAGTEGIVEGFAFYSTIETESLAAFGEIGYDLTDATKLTVGIRWTQDERDFHGANAFWCNDGVGGLDYFGGIPCDQFSIPGVIPAGALPYIFPAPDRADTWEEPTYRIVLDHKLNEDVLIYASYNHGFRSGNFNTVNPGGDPVEPEVMDAYEIGIKGDFLDGTLRINAAAYYYEVEDLILQVLQGFTLTSVNAAEAETTGLDVDITWLPTDNLELFLGFSALDSEYTNFPNAGSNPTCNQAVVPAGCMIPPRANGSTVSIDASGNQLIYAPDLTMTVGATYTLPTENGNFIFSARALYSDEYPFVVDQRIVQDDYTVVNLSAGWRAPSDKWGIRLTARNVTDEEYLVFGTAQAGNNGDIAAAADPRTYFLSVDYSF